MATPSGHKAGGRSARPSRAGGLIWGSHSPLPSGVWASGASVHTSGHAACARARAARHAPPPRFPGYTMTRGSFLPSVFGGTSTSHPPGQAPLCPLPPPSVLTTPAPLQLPVAPHRHCSAPTNAPPCCGPRGRQACRDGRGEHVAAPLCAWSWAGWVDPVSSPAGGVSEPQRGSRGNWEFIALH